MIAIIGTGFAGLGMAIRLRRAGVTDLVILERDARIGGTWRDNTYPGCACDVPSTCYSLSFAPNADWSRTYAPASEIRAYLERLVADHGLGPSLRLGCEVTGGAWRAGRWELDTTGGRLDADVVIGATGPLIEPSVPALPGLDAFDGPAFHSSRWEHEHDLAGKAIAVVGTGASAIQFVPALQPRARSVSVFQRSAPWILPKLDRPTGLAERTALRLPGVDRAVRSVVWGAGELVGIGMHTDPRLLRPLELVARAHLARQVPDRALRARLTPDYRIGCKRILSSNDYLPAVAAPNAAVVTSPIARVEADAVVTADGTRHAADAIVFGTGYRVPVGEALDLLRGPDGRTVREAAGSAPVSAYLGTTFAGFPNLFMLVGPNSGIGHNSLLHMIEAQIEYVLDAVRVMRRDRLASVAVRPDAQRAFNAELQAASDGTVWLDGGCGSWYLDAEGRNTTLWPGSTWSFRRRTRRFDAEHYELEVAA